MADGPAPGLIDRALARAPSRETLEHNRLLRPFAPRLLAPALWSLNRRSVPRGVAVGLFGSVLFPFGHMVVAALLSVPARANVAVAVAVTWINNPFTAPPLYVGAYRLGRAVLRFDAGVPGRPIATNVARGAGWLHWLVWQGGPATIVGLMILSVLFAAAGYLATALGWRMWTARKWRRRHVTV